MLKNKNHDIITEFIISNRESAYRQAYSYVHNKEDALDIVQAAICKALSSAKSLDNPEYLKSWFYRIVVNTALDNLRERKKYLYMDDEALESIIPCSNDSYQNFDLKNAIEKLSTDNKTIIILRFYEDMKLEEIANITNENISTVKSRLYSTLKKLRIDLDECSRPVNRTIIKKRR
jgi:RNA polymerase sigma-70 factor (ECF subfamily)